MVKIFSSQRNTVKAHFKDIILLSSTGDQLFLDNLDLATSRV